MISGEFQFRSLINDRLPVTEYRPVVLDVPLPFNVTLKYNDGNAAKQAKKTFYHKTQAVGAIYSLNLSTMICTDGSAGMTHIRELFVFHDGTDEAYYIDLFDGVNAFRPHMTGTSERCEAGDFVRVCKSGGALGYPVGSNNILYLNPGVNTVPFRICILGSTV